MYKIYKIYIFLIVIVLAHPNTHSLSHRISEWILSICAREGVSAAVQDLYAHNFPPLLSQEEMRRNLPLDSLTLRYIRELSSAKALFFLHPVWWGMPPAILKGWLDRCLQPGVAFERGDAHQALLTSLRAGVIATADDHMGEAGKALSRLWHYALHYCGIAVEEVYILEHKRDGYDPKALRRKTEEMTRFLIATSQSAE